ncbi:MAG: methyltransferase domain-containing protein [Patescibacteria group bacterium]|nr:methyltransferase domain-containing protein [Patescibacteria group bacterium]
MGNNTRDTLIAERGYSKDVAGDTLALYISNNPAAAQWLAKRIGDPDKTLLELCCGVGVTLQHLASVFKKVIGVDIDRQTLRACRENLTRRNLVRTAELILGDVRDVSLLKTLEADVVIYDIPYWYPQKYRKYGAQGEQRENPDLVGLVNNVRKFISKDIVVFAPKEMDYEYFKNILGKCEHVEIFINNKHDRNYVLFGDLIKKAGGHSVNL